jgi:hypothetical protein
MNYYGTMTIETMPDGFPDFLKLALRNVPEEAPYRGPSTYQEGKYAYTCQWEGTTGCFKGEEVVTMDGQVIYTLSFHGGKIIE